MDLSKIENVQGSPEKNVKKEKGTGMIWRKGPHRLL